MRGDSLEQGGAFFHLRFRKGFAEVEHLLNVHSAEHFVKRQQVLRGRLRTAVGQKLKQVFIECRRVLKDDGLMVFSYHHSRDDGWASVAEAVWGAGFDVVQAQVTATQIFDPIPSVGIDQWALVGEIGATSVIDFPSKGTLRFDGPNTPLPGGVRYETWVVPSSLSSPSK